MGGINHSGSGKTGNFIIFTVYKHRFNIICTDYVRNRDFIVYTEHYSRLLHVRDKPCGYPIMEA